MRVLCVDDGICGRLEQAHAYYVGGVGDFLPSVVDNTVGAMATACLLRFLREDALAFASGTQHVQNIVFWYGSDDVLMLIKLSSDCSHVIIVSKQIQQQEIANCMDRIIHTLETNMKATVKTVGSMLRPCVPNVFGNVDEHEHV